MQKSCEYQFFMVFGFTRPGIEPESTDSAGDALSTRPLIGTTVIVDLQVSHMLVFKQLYSLSAA